MIIVFLTNAIRASLATLWTSQFGLRVLLSIITAILLGIIAMRNFPYFYLWELVALFILFVFPTLIIIASLLVVRSCGYRLVPKTPASN
jgi:hypothetical protein